jgi:hypothetical protein
MSSIILYVDMEVATAQLLSSIIQELLIVSSNTKRQHESRTCSSMSSIMKELLSMSSIILRQVWSHADLPAARSHSIMGVARMRLYKSTWKSQLLNDEQYNMRTAHR